MRVELKEGYNFQVRIYYNHDHGDYAYQLFSHVPLLRWDNKEEFPLLATFPHHHHDEQGKVKPSPLLGEPLKDINIVLAEVSKFFRME